jgi:hypothetical protein
VGIIGAVIHRFPALRHQPFRRYIIGQTIAMTGGFASNVAMAWLAYRTTGSVALLGVLGFALMAPSIIVSPIAVGIARPAPRPADRPRPTQPPRAPTARSRTAA